MAGFETLFMLAGFLVGLVLRGGMFLFLLPLAVVALALAIMNRPRPMGSMAKKIVTLILSVAYLVSVFVCFTHFKGGSKGLEEAPKKETAVALQEPDYKYLSGMAKKVDKIYSMLYGIKAEYSLIGKDDLERVKAEIAIYDDELIECDPKEEKGCLQFTNIGAVRDSNRFYTVALSWVLPRFQVYPKGVHRKIIKGLLGEDLTDADTAVLDAEYLGKIQKRTLYRQAEQFKHSIESELRNYPGDWFYDSAHTEVAASLRYDREDRIDVAFNSQLWTTYLVLKAGYYAGAAEGYEYVYHRTFSKVDGALVDSAIFNPNEKEKIISLLRKYAEKYDANADAIGMKFQLEPSFLKDGIGFDGYSFEIGGHTHGSVMIVVPYKEILPYVKVGVRRKFGLTEDGGP